MKAPTKRTLIITGLIAFVIMAFLAVSSADYEDAKRQQQAYCDNVKAGYWPDYNGNAVVVCK